MEALRLSECTERQNEQVADKKRLEKREIAPGIPFDYYKDENQQKKCHDVFVEIPAVYQLLILLPLHGHHCRNRNDKDSRCKNSCTCPVGKGIPPLALCSPFHGCTLIGVSFCYNLLHLTGYSSSQKINHGNSHPKSDDKPLSKSQNFLRGKKKRRKQGEKRRHSQYGTE